MSPAATVDEIIRLAQGLSPLEKLKVIERLAPDLETALTPENDADPTTRTLDDQYQRGYEQIPEDVSGIEALLPHLPLQSEPW
ncbi:MAG TPA: hypothetical protein VIM11_16105 [Tepidisphaeraceae bacterium]|jgi:hypothetical protein